MNLDGPARRVRSQRANESGRSGTFTTDSPRLARSEVITTVLAMTTSSALYVRSGHPYLARGVVGDVVGLAILAIVLQARGDRARHEAVACLATIGVVSVTRARWPLRIPSGLWWLLIATVTGSYLGYRHQQLLR